MRKLLLACSVLVFMATTLGSASATEAGTNDKRKNCHSLVCRSDATAPTAPSGIRVTSATPTSITISWNASTDDVGVREYSLYRNTSYVESTLKTTYTHGSLSCGTGYQLGVQAVDYAGNKSALASVVAATSPCGDTQAPTAPSRLAVTSVAQTSASISWSPSTDNVGVAGYGVYIGGTKVGSTTSTSYSFSALSCGTSYSVSVDAYDAAGNRSAKAAITVVTSACSTTDTVAPGWTTVLNDQFNDGLIPAHYTLYDGPYRTGNCATPSHVSVSGGYLHLLMRYETSGKCGAGWYTAGLSIAPAYRDAPYNLAAVEQRVTIRFRIVNGGVSSHRIIPMRSPLTIPYSPDGEEDFCENDGPLTGCNTFLHYGGSGRIWHPYTVDLSQWHTMRFVHRNYTITAYIDDMTTPVWSYVGNATTLPDVKRKLVLQQECPSVYGSCPTGTAGYEDIQVDWITIDNAT